MFSYIKPFSAQTAFVLRSLFILDIFAFYLVSHYKLPMASRPRSRSRSRVEPEVVEVDQDLVEVVDLTQVELVDMVLVDLASEEDADLAPEVDAELDRESIASMLIAAGRLTFDCVALVADLRQQLNAIASQLDFLEVQLHALFLRFREES